MLGHFTSRTSGQAFSILFVGTYCDCEIARQVALRDTFELNASASAYPGSCVFALGARASSARSSRSSREKPPDKMGNRHQVFGSKLSSST